VVPLAVPAVDPHAPPSVARLSESLDHAVRMD
jgi:hypothetical protein